MKECINCKQNLDESQFHYRNKEKGYRHSTCKKCKSENKYTNKKDICNCGKEKDYRSKICYDCRIGKRISEANYQLSTLEDKTYVNHKYSKYSYVRYYSRKIGIELGFKCCKICGYDKHFEVCHIKPVASFPKDTLITVVNDISNLIPLCPNCHWELDNGILKL